MIYKFDDYLFEYSRNDKIKELTSEKKKKTAIFVFGPPAGGKTTFLNKYVIPKLKNFKVFDPDKLILTLLRIDEYNNISKTEEEIQEKIKKIKATLKIIKEKYNIELTYFIDSKGNKRIFSDDVILEIINNNIFVQEMPELLKKQLITYISNSKSDFVYDTTGNDFDRINYFSKLAKKNGYDVIFVNVATDLEKSIKNNLGRNRVVQLDYQLTSWEKNQEILPRFMKLNPSAFYFYETDNKKITKII